MSQFNCDIQISMHMFVSIKFIKTDYNNFLCFASPMLDEKVVIPFCPIVTPTEKDFENFYEFVEKLQATYRRDYAFVKVVPPKGWKAHGENYETLKKQMRVKKPIQQHAKMSKNDFYEIRNIIQQSMNLPRFQKKIADKNAISETSLQKVEQKFWKTVKYTPPIYGADLHKSLMSPEAGSWNLGDLDSLLRDAAPVLIKGVTYPYCYVGTWKSIFCWHKEDLDLSAINYLHEGNEKIWYGIQPGDQGVLEDEAREAFPENYLNCKHFLRHKTTLINPYKLKQKHPNLKISKSYQGPNEFMVVFSGSYHCGFNSGKNIAEAVNFATRQWLRVLEGVNFCECTQRSVRPDYKYFLDNLQKTSRFRNDPYLKHLKNWVIKNGLYIDSGTAEEETLTEKREKKRSSKSSSSNEEIDSKYFKKQKKIKKNVKKAPHKHKTAKKSVKRKVAS